MRLKDKVAVITGAGSGIGRTTAIFFAREGARVGVVDLDGERASQTVQAIEQAGGQAIVVAADISTRDGAERAVNLTADAFGRVHILFSNAGITLNSTHQTIEDVDDDEWHRVLDVNLKGVYLCARYVVPQMKQAGSGSIINTASVAGMLGMRGLVYGASKGGVIALTRTMAVQLAPFKIRVNAIAPGSVDTPLARSLRAALSPQEQAAHEAELVRMTPLGRRGTTDDIAYAALYLASDEASFVTGHTLVVDGGYSAQ